MPLTFDLAIEHANSASFSRSVDPTATRRIKPIMARQGWRNVVLRDVDYGHYAAGLDRCVSVYHYDVLDTDPRPFR